MLTIDEAEELISRAVAACIRVEYDHRRGDGAIAREQAALVRQAAEDIVNGKRPRWDGECQGKAAT